MNIMSAKMALPMSLREENPLAFNLGHQVMR